MLQQWVICFISSSYVSYPQLIQNCLLLRKRRWLKIFWKTIHTIIQQHSFVLDCLFFSVLRPQKIGVEFATRQLEFESGINYPCTIDSITANRYLCHFILPCWLIKCTDCSDKSCILSLPTCSLPAAGFYHSRVCGSQSLCRFSNLWNWIIIRDLAIQKSLRSKKCNCLQSHCSFEDQLKYEVLAFHLCRTLASFWSQIKVAFRQTCLIICEMGGLCILWKVFLICIFLGHQQTDQQIYNVNWLIRIHLVGLRKRLRREIVIF